MKEFVGGVYKAEFGTVTGRNSAVTTEGYIYRSGNIFVTPRGIYSKDGNVYAGPDGITVKSGDLFYGTDGTTLQTGGAFFSEGPMTIALLISAITNTLWLLAGVVVGAAIVFWFKTHL